MTRKRLVLLVLAALLAVAAAVVLLQRRPWMAGAAQATLSDSAARSAGAFPTADAPVEFGPADTMTLAPTTLTRAIPITGSLRAANQAVVRSKTSGEIRDLTVREGMPVRRGQPIARIDPIDAEQRLREREAQLAVAAAQLAQARRELDTNRALTERGFISQNAFDRAGSSFEVAEASRRAAAAQVEVARKALADTTVYAPIDGVVAERFAQVGEKVSPDARIVSILDLSRMEIEAPVPAEDVARVRIGQPVTLRIEGIDAPQTGRVARIAPGTQAGSRSVPIWIALDGADARVRAGLFAQGTLALERREGVLAVPYAAVRDRGGRTFVYLIEGGRIVERDVRPGLRDDAARAPNGAAGLVQMIEGLAAGDRVVAANLGTLRAGASARLASPDSSASAPASASSAPPASAAVVRAD